MFEIHNQQRPIAWIHLMSEAVSFALELSEYVVGDVAVIGKDGKIAAFKQGRRTYPVRYCHPSWKENCSKARKAKIKVATATATA